MKQNASATCPVGTISKLLLLTDRRVQQLTAEGVIPKAERGRYELAPSVQGYIRYLQERSLRSDVSPVDYQVEKARLTKAQADTAEVLLAKTREELLSADLIERNLANLFEQVKANMRSIPERVTPAVIAMKDERAIKAKLLYEIDAVLSALASSDVLIEDDPEKESEE